MPSTIASKPNDIVSPQRDTGDLARAAPARMTTTGRQRDPRRGRAAIGWAKRLVRLLALLHTMTTTYPVEKCTRTRGISRPARQMSDPIEACSITENECGHRRGYSCRPPSSSLRAFSCSCLSTCWQATSARRYCMAGSSCCCSPPALFLRSQAIISGPDGHGCHWLSSGRYKFSSMPKPRSKEASDWMHAPGW